jgi:hypothetical protein
VSAAPTNAAAASDTPAQNEDLSLPASRETLSAIEGDAFLLFSPIFLQPAFTAPFVLVLTPLSDFEASFGRQHPRLLPLSLPHALQVIIILTSYL